MSSVLKWFTKQLWLLPRFSTAGSRVGQCHMPTFTIHLRIGNYLKRTFLAILWQRVWIKLVDGLLLSFRIIWSGIIVSLGSDGWRVHFLPSVCSIMACGDIS